MKHQKHYKRFLFLLAMLLTVTFAVAQTDERTKKQKDYLSFIQGQTISPFDYLSQKIKQYNVVSLGEDHWIKDHMLFLADYLDYVANDTTFHIDALAWESGNSIDQKKADTLMMSKTFREDLALQILRDAPDTYGWPYKEALEDIKANPLDPSKPDDVEFGDLGEEGISWK